MRATTRRRAGGSARTARGSGRVSSSPTVFNAAGEHIGFAKVTRDSTERRQLAQERERAVEALATANQELESLNGRLQQAAQDQSQFLAVTAHELRTPIGVLSGSVDMLSQHWRQLPDEDRSDLLDAMTASTGRLRRLLADLLTASRLQASALEMRVEPVQVRCRRGRRRRHGATDAAGSRDPHRDPGRGRRQRRQGPACPGAGQPAEQRPAARSAPGPGEHRRPWRQCGDPGQRQRFRRGRRHCAPAVRAVRHRSQQGVARDWGCSSSASSRGPREATPSTSRRR